jgi:uncharacterized protein YuzE
MYIERDTSNDQLYISFGSTGAEGEVDKTIEVLPGVYLDLNASGKLVGMDIVSVEEVTGSAVSELDLAGELLSIEGVAEILGKSRQELENDIERSDFPEPLVRMDEAIFWLSQDIQEYRSIDRGDVIRLGERRIA